MLRSVGPQNDPATVFSTATGSPIAFTDDGLVMGDGTTLVHMSKRADAGLALEDDRDRFAALMSVVGGRTVAADAIGHVEAADAHWRRGDKALANLRLILADLPRVATAADACRLTLAAHLLDEGMPPAELMEELGFATQDDLEKYSRDQPRVPEGHGRESGRFGSGGGSQAFVPPIVVAPSALTPAAGALVAPIAGLVAFGLAMVVPTPNSGGIDEGTLPDMPDVRYRKDGPAGTLKLTTTAPDGSDVTVHAGNNRGAYVDIRTGQTLGRDHGTSISLDKPAVGAAIDAEIAAQVEEEPERGSDAANHEPQLCPAAGPDKPHGTRGLAYEIKVHARVNPDDPTPPQYGYRIWDPGEQKFFFVDDCFKKHGDLVDGDMKPGDFADAKGEEYKQLFSKRFAESVIEKLRLQGERQVRAAAARGARVKWYFAQKDAAAFIKEDFKKRPLLNKIIISHMPP